MVKKQPHNPGLSDKAWDNLHKMLAKTNIKYADQIKNGRTKGEKKDG